MQNWNCLRIDHSRTNAIDLYCRQVNDCVEVCITNANQSHPSILIHDLLNGRIDDIFLDQDSNQIAWNKKKFNFKKSLCVFDMTEARQRQGISEEINFLKFHVANAINGTYTNKAFSGYLRRHIPGEWKFGAFAIIFNKNGTYEVPNIPAVVTPLKGIASKGKYRFFRNMLFLDGNGLIGLRIQIINIIGSKLYFGGLGNALYFVLEKQ